MIRIGATLVLKKMLPKPKNNLVSLDLETKCAVDGCPGTIAACDHALIPHKAKITVIGLYYKTENDQEFSKVYRNLDELVGDLAPLGRELKFVGQNFKFDYKHLAYHGYNLYLDQYAHDTQLMASAAISKVTPEYLSWYSAEREKRNKLIGKGNGSHRPGSRNSLKVLAPFFLGVPPFWEDPTNHDNDEYVLRDCKYTYELYEFFSELLKKEEVWEFYEGKLMPWTRMLTEIECTGIKIDLPLLKRKFEEDQVRAALVRDKLDEQWVDAHKAYHQMKLQEVETKYTEMYLAALHKLQAKKGEVTDDKREQLVAKYQKLEAAAKLKVADAADLDSPTQLAWVLRDYFGLDIKNFDDEDSTGKQVLNRLVSEGRDDIKTFLDYRKLSKLCTAFYPSYLDMIDKNLYLFCSFNPTGTRTGRLSSSTPNLQQVPGDLHQLFIARPGYKLITRDLSAIEPCLAAYYTQDPELCALIIRGGDFHSRNAMIMFGLDCKEYEVKELYPNERKIAKTCGLALLYGAGPYRIQQTAMTVGLDWPLWRCKEIRDNFKMAYETAYSFKEDLDAYAISNPITTYFGRKHTYPDPTEIYMKAFNTLVQSTASDLMLEGCRKALQEIRTQGLDAQPLLFVHDEAVFEAEASQAEAVAKLIDKHVTSFELSTPFGLIPLKTEGKISDRWEK